MTTLNKYLVSLLAEVKSANVLTGATATAVAEACHQPAPQPNATSGCRLRSIEFTIPIAIDQADGSAGRSLNNDVMNQRTFAAIREVMCLDRFPDNQFLRLRNALEIENRKLDALLVKENILLDRALKDYIQRLVATAYDEYLEALHQHASSSGRAPKAAGTATSDFSLEEATERLTGILLPEIKQNLQVVESDNIAVTVESHKLKDYPPNLLTYVKLLISEEELEDVPA